ncbi:hypothetical protein KSF_067670 [Reticulibacter mediterranei]|uniref:Uncharacterized protein n=1 Tax=Reticulibacter mediterranei TaxID=2778369 RepID=A0A8J3IJI9_9CHLR|nr:hypothetical protein KSF_067670 [Reticulibacter mediterranei]
MSDVHHYYQGIQLASQYQSKRHIGWIDKSYNRLHVLPIGQDKRLNTLGEALKETMSKQEAW